MSKHLLLLTMLLFSFSHSSASEGEAKALERLAVTTDMLISAGDEMVDEPFSGLLVLNDTLSLDMNLNSTYSYQFIIWTNSTFNFVDFWLTNPQGICPSADLSDHTTLTIMPDSVETGIWQLEMELLEGAYSDSAYYAAAVFRRPRSLH
ncbi:MAG: hypothetical protein KAH54_09635 [Candidatus Sabulitectum sp.]|nr:hypothetical protein [Candidatus Sabulitectum sp.]